MLVWGLLMRLCAMTFFSRSKHSRRGRANRDTVYFDKDGREEKTVKLSHLNGTPLYMVWKRMLIVTLSARMRGQTKQTTHSLPGRSHHTHSGDKYCNWHPIIWMFLCVCERLCRILPVRKAATSETAVLETIGTLSERSSPIWEEEEEVVVVDTGGTTPWTAWIRWVPDPTASHLTPLLKAAARVGDIISFPSTSWWQISSFFLSS